MQKYLAEFFGTFMLVFLGTGAVTVAAGNTLTIGLAFGLAITGGDCWSDGGTVGNPNGVWYLCGSRSASYHN